MSLHQKTVLIVDDDPDFRELLQIFLRKKGFVTREAPNCKSAIAALGEPAAHVDAVLLDYYMPGLPPSRCTERLKEVLPEGTPIILITAAVDASLRARELHLTHYLPKPFDMDALVGVIRRAIESCSEITNGESWTRPSASLD